MKEVVSTEESYLKYLQAMKRLYADPLLAGGDGKKHKLKGLMSEQDAKTVFGNLEILINVSMEMLHQLQRVIITFWFCFLFDPIPHFHLSQIPLTSFNRQVMKVAGESLSDQAQVPIGEAFLKIFPYLKTYAEYVVCTSYLHSFVLAVPLVSSGMPGTTSRRTKFWHNLLSESPASKNTNPTAWWTQTVLASDCKTC